ncbi:MAG: hypothetical protein IT580_11020 [Verrucomicrobiales bacterium]|nr:hypothetical protein [Verrucomicrobiales bacterium]
MPRPDPSTPRLLLSPSLLRREARNLLLSLLLSAASAPWLHAQSSGVLQYQGRIQVGEAAFEGRGQFKFALVHRTGTQTLWRNAPDANGDGEPDLAVTVTVAHGMYDLSLGDTSLANMAPIPAAVFSQSVPGLTSDPLYLRVWFNDGTSGFELLSPDQRLSAVGYAMAAVHAQSAASVEASAVTGVLAASQLPDLDASRIQSGVLALARLPAQLALKDPDLREATNQFASQLQSVQRQIEVLKAELAALGAGDGGVGGPLPGTVLASAVANDVVLTGLGYEGFASLAAGGWSAGATELAPTPRVGHGATWIAGAGRWIVWGGQTAPGTFANSGATYDASANTWQTLPVLDSPSPRRGATVVSDGVREVMVWGGFGDAGFLSDGARFDTATARWRRLPTLGAPSGRDGHAAAWIGSALVVYGGRNGSGKLADGAWYRPVIDTWSPLPVPGAPSARSEAALVWTGRDLLVWGGLGPSGAVATGARLRFTDTPDPVPESWLPMTAVGAPAARHGHAAVWTGSRLLVWGGYAAETYLGDGASYDPVAGVWTPIPASGAPSPRAWPWVAWTGSELLIAGGETARGPVATGAAYHPGTGRWRPLADGGDTILRSGATTAWSGRELLVFGGQSGSAPIAAFQRLNPQPSWHLYRKP